jgi:3-deoxy-D-manno-octulosonate 8-phosphate phosphatase (KDO 8-P phosphatase)
VVYARPHAMHDRLGTVALFAFDIDGTLTDGTTTWMGPRVGWVQTYSVRDGEALLRLRRAGVPAVPLSRNRTLCARTRMEGLGLPLDWLGVADKLTALQAIRARYGVDPARICYVGDGLEDVPVLSVVGFPCAVADGHARARAAAAYVTEARGGCRAVEEIVDLILGARETAS